MYTDHVTLAPVSVNANPVVVAEPAVTARTGTRGKEGTVKAVQEMALRPTLQET